ncbi:MAG: hypothetical protein JJE46_02645 [Acidimicrobiia bacterium]|nr:hypothetical protein [Acidimicrobiia bacterium]
MTDGTELVTTRLPADALARLDEIVAVEGGTRADAASRLLVKALADLDTGEMVRQQAYSLLDVDEDLAGP